MNMTALAEILEINSRNTIADKHDTRQMRIKMQKCKKVAWRDDRKEKLLSPLVLAVMLYQMTSKKCYDSSKTG